MPLLCRLLLILVLACGAAPDVRAQAPLALDDAAGRVDAWPAITVLVEPAGPLGLEQARAAAAQFKPPGGARGSLGLSKAGVWLRLPLRVAPGSDGRWVLDIDYPPLNRVDVHLVTGGRAVRSVTLGNLQRFADRPLGSRTLAVPLDLPPDMSQGAEAELWLRVQASGGLILPITLSKPATFHALALREQLLQGLLGGLGLFLVLYSLMQWLTLREHLFGKYALLTSASVMFSVFQFGIGAQVLWPDRPWVELHAGGLCALLASAGSALFVEHALRPHRWRGFAALMKGVAALLVTAAAAFALDLLDVHQVSAVIGTLGLAPALLGLPGAVVLARRGDGVGWALLAAWLGYFVATAVMVGLIRGRIDAGFWSLHSFQLGATLDILLFMRVIALRLKAVQLAAQRATREREALLSMAHADPLTGLANRRGLHAALDHALPRATPQRQVAVFLLDLDGFKAVNDQHGHEAGDELLVAVARRLQASVRSDAGDLVARLGGDEFVIVVGGLREERQAREVADHLLRCFTEPFALAGGTPCRLGTTIGFALAPADGAETALLLKRADAAMYRGKQGGASVVAHAG
ncbi:GGDEF domain-containing protein [Aquincola sp. S2]|uniref:GGDEF domain-containing protein n=1 Tax=Pseudaquabacterium terrae TaxID=2732868 RepID=A0ABX2E9M8_9BURK|nr:diguanylate cyclase [Aquabacterium terrae]NRF65468.1 GGDEF domain-containing protein [Aquabacterium terrae]